jgi:hypothetical protein
MPAAVRMADLLPLFFPSSSSLSNENGEKIIFRNRQESERERGKMILGRIEEETSERNEMEMHEWRWTRKYSSLHVRK